ncbi:putative histidine transporter YuiF (NhaC family) [Virgibacillus natechei]|uniref:Histidine transporter YuiF (NhaC family) n=1 Tax=Virgibacillus natechei TaxID=1216297 RepID=A0ABS4IJU2_9BACI|nr:Na+/H+ antiporter NhaC family protein [Virgibacillus natechei]MBP1970611.1 putative histidine transporter YuiF (NhaC family) [Virgibacillus natechei]UZD13998.1 TRAP transporter large permease subunit [Virgibacillus natechei]
MGWVVVISVLVMTVLSLLRVNVIIAIIAAALTAGVMAGLGVVESIEMLVSGMGGQANTALSYILLGAFAVAISYTGITTILVNYLIRVLTGKKTMMLLVIAGVASLSQNLVPVHIAFIPILIPPLLKLFDEMRMDRRATAAALTFGLKAPYVMIPAGFGLIFHNTIVDGMEQNGVQVTVGESALSMLIPGLGMVIGLLIAIFITYRKDRDAIPGAGGAESTIMEPENKNVTFNRSHLFTLIAIGAALTVQLITDNLIAGALTGLVLMFAFIAVPFKNGDKVVSDGISMMGTIAFVMLVASGYGEILTETGAVNALVEVSSGFLGDNQPLIAIILLLVGLIVTMGIGSSFGTIPILAALYVPICVAAGFSPMATATLIGTAGALGDAGSPASDSTLGSTAGLNADGKHHHIWDTVVPTFIHFNIPLILFGWIAAIIL